MARVIANLSKKYKRPSTNDRSKRGVNLLSIQERQPSFLKLFFEMSWGVGVDGSWLPYPPPRFDTDYVNCNHIL